MTALEFVAYMNRMVDDGQQHSLHRSEMKYSLILCALFVAGCATTGMPARPMNQGNIATPVYSHAPAAPTPPAGRVVRLLDSRTIQEFIRRDRDEATLSLGDRARKTLYIAGLVVALYVLIDSQQEDDDDCGITWGLPRPCDYPYSQ